MVLARDVTARPAETAGQTRPDVADVRGTRLEAVPAAPVVRLLAVLVLVRAVVTVADATVHAVATLDAATFRRPQGPNVADAGVVGTLLAALAVPAPAPDARPTNERPPATLTARGPVLRPPTHARPAKVAPATPVPFLGLVALVRPTATVGARREVATSKVAKERPRVLETITIARATRRVVGAARPAVLGPATGRPRVVLDAVRPRLPRPSPPTVPVEGVVAAAEDTLVGGVGLFPDDAGVVLPPTGVRTGEGGLRPLAGVEARAIQVVEVVPAPVPRVARTACPAVPRPLGGAVAARAPNVRPTVATSPATP